MCRLDCNQQLTKYVSRLPRSVETLSERYGFVTREWAILSCDLARLHLQWDDAIHTVDQINLQTSDWSRANGKADRSR